MHLDFLSVFWNVVAATGVCFSVAVIPQYIAAREGVNSPRRNLTATERRGAILLSHNYIWSESSRLACHLISLCLGIWSVFLPPVNNQEPQPHIYAVFGVAFVLGLVTINCLTVQNSIRAYLGWRKSYAVVVARRRRHSS